jgi:hypothetical protein
MLAAALVAGTVAFAIPAAAAPGDIYKVTGQKVNLRSAPSDNSTIRSTVVNGDELIELRRDGSWLGVRVLGTGQEGWIYTGLVGRVSQTGLGEAPISQGGFGKLSPEFDSLVATINDMVGYSMVGNVEQVGSSLRVTPTRQWLYNTSLDAKLYSALALYQMWKNYNNGNPVDVALGSNESEAILVSDTSDGPVLRMPQVLSQR